jgi:hypothetical protein
MRVRVFARTFKTKVEVLKGVKNKGLLIRTTADNNNLEQNRAQIAGVLGSYGFLSDHTFMVSSSDSVFVEPRRNRQLYVAGNPHICGGFFNRELKLYEGAFISKGMKYGKIKADWLYDSYILVNQKYRWQASYQNLNSTEEHFFKKANEIVVSSSTYTNGANENKLVNAGGSFWLLAINNEMTMKTFAQEVVRYTSTHNYYDRLDDSCVHSLLECLNIPIPNTYGLSTQSGLSLIIEHFRLPKPTIENCLKEPLDLGGKESQRLQSILLSNDESDKFADEINQYLGLHMPIR